MAIDIIKEVLSRRRGDGVGLGGAQSEERRARPLCSSVDRVTPDPTLSTIRMSAGDHVEREPAAPKKARKRVAAGGGTAAEIRQVLGPNACAALEDRLSAHFKPGQTALKHAAVLDVLRHVLLSHQRPPFLSLRFPALVRHVLVIAHEGSAHLAPDATGMSEPFAKAHGAFLATPMEARVRLAAAYGDRPGGVRSLYFVKDGTALEEEVEAGSCGGGSAADGPVLEVADALKTLLASAEEMRAAGYPELDPEASADAGGEREPAALRCAEPAQQHVEPERGPPRLFALDCEMVETVGGATALARVSIVDSAEAVRYDALVLPAAPISDYRTQWSGITAAKLRGVTLSAAAARDAVRAIVRPSDVLIGHSLENDLRALGMAHAHCIDTALLFPHPLGGGRKRKLAHLASELLGEAIQQPQPQQQPHGKAQGDKQGEEEEEARGGGGGDADGLGHDSIADARACMRLVLARLRNPSLGVRRQRLFLTVPQLLRVYGPPAEQAGAQPQPLRCAHFDSAKDAATAEASSAAQRARAHLIAVRAGAPAGGVPERRTLTWCVGRHTDADVHDLLAACPPNALVVSLAVADGAGTGARECAMTLAIRRPS